jgi:4-aminobutyrate aminotransferase-like enzyme/Ser/Thr protein kinase RdoA (MazF antagonist)
MKFLKIEQPRFTTNQTSRFLMEAYGLSGTLQPLESERDQNFRLRENDGRHWVVKITNKDEPPGIVTCQVAAMAHIGSVDPSFPAPRPKAARDGRVLTTIRGENGVEHLFHVLSYLPGEVVGDRTLPPKELRDVGAMVARLGRAMRGFFHEALAARALLWDNREAPRLKEYVRLLPSAADRALSADVIDRFQANTLPSLAALRAQAIHGDVHPSNLLVDKEGTLSGIIDFGDMIHAPLIQDLANVIGDFLHPDQEPQTTIAALVEGYRAVTELEEAEIAVLSDLIQVRLLQTPLIYAIRNENKSQSESYRPQFSARCLALIAALRAMGPELDRLLRRKSALPTTPETTSDKKEDERETLSRRFRVLGDKLYMFYDPPLHLVSGQGVWLADAQGRRYLDCYNNVPHVGHCHPYVAEAIVRQTRRLNTNTRYLTDQSIEYAERLTQTLDPSLSVVAYVNSGSEANDLAWRMAKAWTCAKGGIAMEFAYHGITEASDAFSPSGSRAGRVPPHIRLLPPPDDYRGPYKRGEANLAERYAALADAPIRELTQSGQGIAAAMIDAAFMTNGMLEAPQGYVAAIAAKVRAAGGLFVADEVQSGFGRMGSAMWGHQHHGVVPDFVTIGKPAGNGFPLGAVVTRREILERFMEESAFFSTFGGNNVACAAGIAVLDVIRDEGLVHNARETGLYLKEGLRRLMDKHAIVGDVRGTGLAIGMELVLDRDRLTPATDAAKRLLSLVRDEGALVGGEGQFGNIVKIRPPMVFDLEHADIAIAAIDRALAGL